MKEWLAIHPFLGSIVLGVSGGLISVIVTEWVRAIVRYELRRLKP